MIILLLALIGTLIVMAILTIGRLGFGRSEQFNPRRFLRWFIGYSIFNYLLSLLILYLSEPALTGPFGGWQWVLWPLVLSSLINLIAFVRPLAGALDDISTTSQRRRSSNGGRTLPANASRGAIAAGGCGRWSAGGWSDCGLHDLV